MVQSKTCCCTMPFLNKILDSCPPCQWIRLDQYNMIAPFYKNKTRKDTQLLTDHHSQKRLKQKMKQATSPPPRTESKTWQQWSGDSWYPHLGVLNIFTRRGAICHVYWSISPTEQDTNTVIPDINNIQQSVAMHGQRTSLCTYFRNSKAM